MYRSSEYKLFYKFIPSTWLLDIFFLFSCFDTQLSWPDTYDHALAHTMLTAGAILTVVGSGNKIKTQGLPFLAIVFRNLADFIRISWNLADFTCDIRMKSTGFHLKSAGFHLKSARFHEIHMKSAGFHGMWAFAWWSSIGFSFERPIMTWIPLNLW